MQISHTNRWIYVAINKSGSTSMGHYLNKYADENFTHKKADNPLGHHSTIREAKNYFEERGINFNEYFTFTLTRNPWSREYSMYKYRRSRLDANITENNFRQLSEQRQRKLRACIKHSSFKSYFLEKCDNKNRSDSIKRFLTIDGKLAVKYMAKLENLNESLLFLSEKIGISPYDFPHLNERNHSRKKLYEIYDYEMVKASLELFRWEIKNLDYTFNSIANNSC